MSEYPTLHDAIVNNDVDAVDALLKSSASQTQGMPGGLTPIRLCGRVEARMRAIHHRCFALRKSDPAAAEELYAHLAPRWRRHGMIMRRVLAGAERGMLIDGLALNDAVRGLTPMPGAEGALLWLKQMEAEIVPEPPQEGFMKAEDGGFMVLLRDQGMMLTADTDRKTPEDRLEEQMRAARSGEHAEWEVARLEVLQDRIRQERARRIIYEADPVLRLRDRDGATGLHLAARLGDPEEIERQLAARVHVDIPDSERGTPLMYAAASGRREAVSELLSRGATLEAEDAYGDQAIHEAARNGHADVVHVLLEAGADPDARNESDETPLHVVALSGESAAVPRLIRAGADLEIEDSGDATPLARAAAEGRMQICEALLEAGADPNAGQETGASKALYVAVTHSHDSRCLATLDLLIRRGARVSEKLVERAETLAEGIRQMGSKDALWHEQMAARLKKALAPSAPEPRMGM